MLLSPGDVLLFPVSEDAIFCTSEAVLLFLEEVLLLLFSKDVLLLSPVEFMLPPGEIVLSPKADVILLFPNCDSLEVSDEDDAPLLSPAVGASMISSTVALLDDCGDG